MPDVRWFPKRENTASRIVQSLVSGKPSPWLTNGVRTAFTGDVALARNTVTAGAQVAEVALTDAALNADAATLARMRTQLERSLAGVGVLQVKLTAGGRDLNAGPPRSPRPAVDSRPLVLTDKGFGFLSGSELAPVTGVSAELASFPQPIAAISAATGGQRVAVQTTDGVVYAVADGKVDEIDNRPGLIAPVLDPFGFIWTLPQQAPRAIIAWSTVSPPRRSRAAGRVRSLRDRDEPGRIPARDGGHRRRADQDRGRRGDARRPGSADRDRRAERARLAARRGDRHGLAGRHDGRGAHSGRQQHGAAGAARRRPATTSSVPDTTRTVAPASPTANIRLLGGDGVLRVRSGRTGRS